MAEQTYKDASEEIVSEYSGDAKCDPCMDDGQTVPAEGFCIDCNDYLCKPCFRHHRISRPLKRHVLQDRYAMPDKKPSPKGVYCWIHETEYITQYCRTHDTVGCTVCMVEQHANCSRINALPVDIKDKGDSGEFEECVKSVSDSLGECNSLLQRIDHVKGFIREHYTHVKNRVNTVVEAIEEQDIQRNKTLRFDTEKIQSQLRSVQRDLQMKGDCDEYSFIIMMKGKMLVKAMNEKKTFVKTENKATHFGFVDDTSSVNHKESTQLLWTLTTMPTLPVKLSNRRYEGLDILCMTGDGSDVYVLIKTKDKYNTNYCIASINTSTGCTKELTGIQMDYIPQAISYCNNNLHVVGNNGALIHVTYKKMKGSDEFQISETNQVQYPVNLTGHSMIGIYDRENRMYYPGSYEYTCMYYLKYELTDIGTMKQTRVELQEHRLRDKSWTYEIIYHDSENNMYIRYERKIMEDIHGRNMNEKEQYVQAFDITSGNEIGSRVKTCERPSFASFNGLVYMLDESGVYVYRKTLSNRHQVVSLSDQSKDMLLLAVNDWHICVALTEKGPLQVYQRV